MLQLLMRRRRLANVAGRRFRYHYYAYTLTLFLCRLHLYMVQMALFQRSLQHTLDYLLLNL
jgi:hypothetical protein